MFLPISKQFASAEERAKVLVICTTKEDELGENERALDMLISHFATDITFMNSNEVTEKDVKDVTHLFYYGLTPVELPKTFETLFDDYKGAFIAIGYNSEQLGDHFSFIDPKHERGIDQLSLTNNPEQFLEDVPQEIIDLRLNEDVDILIEGKKKDAQVSYPVMVQKNDHYYYGIDTIWADEVILFGEVLHDVFEVAHDDKHPAYIRLEDVHPLVDPKNVEEIAEVLKEKDIPYMIAVIPVYTDPNTGEEFHFSDSPKLLKLLKQMQKDGASILLHGYTHQFRSSETGEGFEFWDVESNTPIYAPADEPITLKEESEFASNAAYQAYLNELKAFEKQYIEEKLTKGIQELVNYGLYPLAFEAPHYTMSQNGYEVVSEYFSMYVGQTQLSDDNWEVMDSTPYITSPTFLHGMELLPETIGYVNPEDPQSIAKMMDNAERMNKTKDSVIAGFYHPYLGVEGFEQLLHQMERQPNIEWINLKEKDVWVKADKVDIYTENGVINVDVNRSKMAFSSWDFLSYHFFKWSTAFAWGLSVVGTVAVLAFIIFTYANYHRRKTVE